MNTSDPIPSNQFGEAVQFGPRLSYPESEPEPPPEEARPPHSVDADTALLRQRIERVVAAGHDTGMHRVLASLRHLAVWPHHGPTTHRGPGGGSPAASNA